MNNNMILFSTIFHAKQIFINNTKEINIASNNSKMTIQVHVGDSKDALMTRLQSKGSLRILSVHEQNVRYARVHLVSGVHFNCVLDVLAYKV